VGGTLALALVVCAALPDPETVALAEAMFEEEGVDELLLLVSGVDVLRSVGAGAAAAADACAAAVAAWNAGVAARMAAGQPF
jgi:hypothetical protein